MNVIPLGGKSLSPVVWDLILQSTTGVSEFYRSDFFREIESLENLREYADYKTGSITTATCWSLLSAAYYFQPRIIFEVGTFIGKSTLSLLRGMRLGGPSHSKIYTCDLSNDIALPFGNAGEVVQFRKQTSTQMLAALCANDIQCDFLALDGRLQKDDFKYLEKVLHPNSIILLDDFEGVEKGVVNATMLMSSLQPSHNLLYPPERYMLSKFGLVDGCTTALIVPRIAFALTNQ